MVYIIKQDNHGSGSNLEKILWRSKLLFFWVGHIPNFSYSCFIDSREQGYWGHQTLNDATFFHIQALWDKMADGTVMKRDLFYIAKVNTCDQNGWKSLSILIYYWVKRYHPFCLSLNHAFIAKMNRIVKWLTLRESWETPQARLLKMLILQSSGGLKFKDFTVFYRPEYPRLWRLLRLQRESPSPQSMFSSPSICHPRTQVSVFG